MSTVTKPIAKAILFSALVIFWVPSTDAALVLSVGQNGTPGQTEFLATPGSQLTIDLFVTATPDSITVPGVGVFPIDDRRLVDDGLAFAGFILEVQGSNRVTAADPSFRSGADFVLDGDVLVGSGRSSVTARLSTPVRLVNNDPRFTPVRTSSPSDSVYFGSVILDIDPTFSGQASFSVGQTIPDAFDFGVGEGFTTVLVGSTQATITAIPEPGAFGLIAAVAGAGLGVNVLRRRRRAVRG